MSGDLTDSGAGRVPAGRTTAGRDDSRVTGTGLAAIAAAALLAGAAQPGLAATGFSPFATVGYQHDSNVFMRPSSEPPFAAEGITALGDSILDYEAGIDGEADWGPERLTLNASATRSDYDRFSSLNNYAYSFGGDLDWRLSPAVDGTVTYKQSRYMAPFTNTFATGLLLDNERTGNVTGRVLVTPEWRLDLTPELHELDTPLPGFPDFKLNERIGIAGLNYLGFGKLMAGVQFTYDDGRYEGIAAATRYQQRDADLTANYKVSGLSTFSAAAGYSERSSEANPAESAPTPPGIFAGYGGNLGKTSSATGALTYQRDLTGKTSVRLSLFRRVDSYAAGANPEIGTGGEVGMTWKADPKIVVNLNYGLTHDQIKGGLVVVNAANRTDRTQNAEFEVKYAALSWLTIRPYVNWNEASSTFKLGNYSALIVGIDVTGRLHW
ncbi:MAG TPA: hypothetical protein VGN43_03285 [Steroidobacteraceae bacterium]|nr:hypothetical protein [Steroidobacteraceae bacterium]